MSSRAADPATGMSRRWSAQRVRDTAPASCGSMMPLASSTRRESEVWIANTVVIMAIRVTSRDSSASTPVPRRRAATEPLASAIKSFIALTTEPNSSGTERRW